MLFNCCACDAQNVTFRGLLMHYKYEHGTDPSFQIVCGVDECAKNYRNEITFWRHIKSKHEQFWIQHVLHQYVALDDNEGGADEDGPEIEMENDIVQDQEPLDVDRYVSSSLLNLRETHKLSQKSCLAFAAACVDMIKMCRETIEKDVYDTLQRSGADVTH